METHTHTSGPWSVSNGLPTVWAKDGERQIADCDKGPLRSTGEDLANAHLIAAAPDLLEALKRADLAIRSLPEEALGVGRSDSHQWLLRDELIAEICAAISKSEGRA